VNSGFRIECGCIRRNGIVRDLVVVVGVVGVVVVVAAAVAPVKC